MIFLFIEQLQTKYNLLESLLLAPYDFIHRIIWFHTIPYMEPYGSMHGIVWKAHGFGSVKSGKFGNKFRNCSFSTCNYIDQSYLSASVFIASCRGFMIEIPGFN